LDSKERPKTPITDPEFRGGFSGRERDVFFYNVDDSPELFPLAYALGLDFADDGRAFAPVDIDGDGDLDIAFASLQQLRLLENRLAPAERHFARVRLAATKSEAQALGAEVVLTAGGVTQRDYVKLTSGFLTQVPRELHFGLGRAETIDKMVVRWPSGRVDELTDLPVDKLIRIVEGEAPAVSDVVSWPAESRPKALGSFALDAAVTKVAGGQTSLAKRGEPVVVNFWAPWCEPCKEELPALAKISKANRDVQFVGVSVEREKKADVTAAIAKFGLGYPQVYANDEVMTSFFGGDGSAALPATFVFSGDGRLARAFYRPIGAAELGDVINAMRANNVDAEMLRLLGEQAVTMGRLAAAKTFFVKGLALDPKSPLLLVHLGNVLSHMGQHDPALKRLRRAIKIDPTLPYAHLSLGKAFNRAGKQKESVAAFKRAVELKPDSPQHWLSYGAGLVRMKELEKASSAFEKVVTLEPLMVVGWMNLGKTRAMLQDVDGAKAAITKVLEITPGNPEAARALHVLSGGVLDDPPRPGSAPPGAPPPGARPPGGAYPPGAMPPPPGARPPPGAPPPGAYQRRAPPPKRLPPAAR